MPDNMNNIKANNLILESLLYKNQIIKPIAKQPRGAANAIHIKLLEAHSPIPALPDINVSELIPAEQENIKLL